MEIREFEQAVLKLAFETEARITTASVAYYLGIPSRQANDMLNLLLEDGVLELDSDETGNLFYRVPQDAGGQNSGVADLKRKIDAAAGTSSTVDAPAPPPSPEARQANRGDRPSIDQFLSRPDGDDDRPAFSPNRGVNDDGGQGVVSGWTGSDQDDSGGLKSRTVRRNRDNWGGFDDYYGKPAGHDGSKGGVRDRSPQAVWASVATRVASPDASLDSCGSSAMVVSTEARCEPRPLPSSRPVIVSCNEEEPVAASNTRSASDLGWFNQNQQDTGAMVPAGEAALSRDYIIDQPEHQPGMALLLSLILPGTGQIYNGEMSKGIMMMVMSFLLWWVLLGWVVHIWSIVDAVVIAERMSRQQG